MVAKTTDDLIDENMWDRLQEGINANRRFRLRGIAGGDNMRYDTTKVIWDSDIYIYFTRESDGGWVYNKINSNPTTGITCNDDDILYVTLNDTTATVLTVSSADYTSMPTDDTGRILVLGAVRGSRWYGISSTDVSHDSVLDVSIDDHHARDHDNTEHSTNYEAANANIQAHVATPPTDSHHAKYALLDDLIANEITAIKAIDDASINNTKWDYVAALTENPQTHMSASNPHSGSGDMNDLIDDTTPQLGGDLDLNQKQMSLNATALADHAATGIIITLTAASSGVTLGNAVYITSAGQIARADADSTTTMPAIGIALETKTSAACQVLIWGYMRDNTWNWVDGGVNGLIYVSNTTGAMTQTPPSGVGDQVQVIGHAIGADYILVMPSPVIVEVS